MVSGLGYDRAAALGDWGERHHELRRVVTDLAAMDFVGGTMRLRSVHPGVSVEQVVAATGFELQVADDVATSRAPDEEELAALERLDPAGLRHREVPGPAPGPGSGSGAG
jgi:hypothetical protein